MKQHPTFTNYIITKDGNVINKKTNRILKLSTAGDGYKVVGLMKDKKQHSKRVNRLVMETYDPIDNPHLYEAHHENEVKTDNRLENLKWELKPDHIREHHKGKVLSEETKRKISEAKKSKGLSEEHKRKLLEANRGKVVSEETRRKIGEHHKGKVLSDETRRKISEAKKGVRRSDETRRKIGEGNKGKVISEETRRKISESMKRKHNQNKKLINPNKI